MNCKFNSCSVHRTLILKSLSPASCALMKLFLTQIRLQNYVLLNFRCTKLTISTLIVPSADIFQRLLCRISEIEKQRRKTAELFSVLLAMKVSYIFVVPSAYLSRRMNFFRESRRGGKTGSPLRTTRPFLSFSTTETSNRGKGRRFGSSYNDWHNDRALGCAQFVPSSPSSSSLNLGYALDPRLSTFIFRIAAKHPQLSWTQK